MLEWMLMPYRKLYRLVEGRSSRQEYWMFVLLNVMILAAILLLFIVFFGGLANLGDPKQLASSTMGAGMIAIILLFIPIYIWMILTGIASFAVTIRRLHDLNLSGWIYLLYVVLAFVPLLNFLAFLGMIAMMCLPGTKGPNQYGEDPTEPHGGASVFS